MNRDMNIQHNTINIMPMRTQSGKKSFLKELHDLQYSTTYRDASDTQLKML